MTCTITRTLVFRQVDVRLARPKAGMSRCSPRQVSRSALATRDVSQFCQEVAKPSLMVLLLMAKYFQKVEELQRISSSRVAADPENCALPLFGRQVSSRVYRLQPRLFFTLI